MTVTKEERAPRVSNREVAINKYTLVVSQKGRMADNPTYVIGNTSAALVEGLKMDMDPVVQRQYDNYDSGSQMVPLCPDGSTLIVQMPGEKLTDENVELATSMYSLVQESLDRVGMRPDIGLQFVPNAHDFEQELKAAGNGYNIVPLFASKRVLGEDESIAQASGNFNNKANFIRMVESISDDQLELRVPRTYFYDPEEYGETGYPSLDEVIESAQAQGSGAIFFKQNVSAGGHGVEKVSVDDTKAVEEAYEKWILKMNEARQNGSDEWDFHVQLGVPNPNILADGSVESPCITAVITPEADGYSVQLLQVALQRIAGGIEHVGNVIDPDYEKEFLGSYGNQLTAVVAEMARQGVRGHVGVDVIVDEGRTIHFLEVNPRLNGSSRCRVIRDNLPEDTYITTNNTVRLSAENQEEVEGLREYFYDPTEPDRPALVLTRFPRYLGDGFGLDFINDRDGLLEKEIVERMQPILLQ